LKICQAAGDRQSPLAAYYGAESENAQERLTRGAVENAACDPADPAGSIFVLPQCTAQRISIVQYGAKSANRTSRLRSSNSNTESSAGQPPGHGGFKDSEAWRIEVLSERRNRGNTRRMVGQFQKLEVAPMATRGSKGAHVRG
jgi:hypothetical protein